MNGIDILCDTNAVLYLLNGNSCMKSHLRDTFHISIISEIELLAFQGITQQEESLLKNFISKCDVITITEDIKNTAIELRKKYQIKLPDALICATAISNNLKLVSADKALQKIVEVNFELLMP